MKESITDRYIGIGTGVGVVLGFILKMVLDSSAGLVIGIGLVYRHRNRCRGSSWFYIENGVRLFSRTCYRYWFGRVWRKYGGPDQTDESEKQYG